MRGALIKGLKGHMPKIVLDMLANKGAWTLSPKLNIRCFSCVFSSIQVAFDAVLFFSLGAIKLLALSMIET